jgi:hypothetical protein
MEEKEKLNFSKKQFFMKKMEFIFKNVVFSHFRFVHERKRHLPELRQPEEKK